MQLWTAATSWCSRTAVLPEQKKRFLHINVHQTHFRRGWSRGGAQQVWRRIWGHSLKRKLADVQQNHSLIALTCPHISTSVWAHKDTEDGGWRRLMNLSEASLEKQLFSLCFTPKTVWAGRNWISRNRRSWRQINTSRNNFSFFIIIIWTETCACWVHLWLVKGVSMRVCLFLTFHPLAAKEYEWISFQASSWLNWLILTGEIVFEIFIMSKSSCSRAILDCR